jgi:hypothetical protein
VGPLLHYQKTCTDEMLVDTIYYAISKLSTRRMLHLTRAMFASLMRHMVDVDVDGLTSVAENRIAIGKHLKELILLLDGNNDKWKEFVLQTITNCSSEGMN